jgi:hypothetical protein
MRIYFLRRPSTWISALPSPCWKPLRSRAAAAIVALADWIALNVRRCRGKIDSRSGRIGIVVLAAASITCAIRAAAGKRRHATRGTSGELAQLIPRAQ